MSAESASFQHECADLDCNCTIERIQRQSDQCSTCGHPHGPPFDFCRYPADEEEARKGKNGYGYTACGCSGE